MKNIHYKKRRYITLIEIMIVMFLIALITGVLAYNYRGSLEEGKAFKTKAGIEKLETILNLAVSENPPLMDHIETQWKEIVAQSPLVQNTSALIKDGWGVEYRVSVDNNQIVVHSQRYDQYQQSNRTLFREK